MWENLDQDREYRPNAVRSVHTIEVKNLQHFHCKILQL